MKLHLFRFGLGLLAILACSCAHMGSNTRPQLPPPIGPVQVRVDVPPSLQPFQEDDVANVFVALLHEEFQRHGYAGFLRQLRPTESADPEIPLLTLNLLEWRIAHAGTVTCTFSGQLQTPDAQEKLGTFTQTSFRQMNGPGRFGLSESFNNSAEGAIGQLYERIAQTGLLAGSVGR
jgi:hypothetical protein